jgi:hypothetical protein
MATNFEDILGELLKNLCNASVFYISKNIQNYIDLNEVKNEDPNFLDILDKPYLINEKGFVVEELEINYALEIIKKKGVLMNNIFLLSQCKDDYGSESLNYILDKYGVYIESFLFISKWLNDNYNEHINSENKDLKRAFNLQSFYFTEHKIEFETRFSIKTLPIANSQEIISSSLQNKGFNLTSLNFTKNAISTKIDSKKVQKNLQKVYINRLKMDTLENAENYLLETVFNVKMNS